MSASIRVLVVDDDPLMRDLVADWFHSRTDGIAVASADDAADALDALDAADGSVDCVVSDFEMPGRDGIGLLETVRERHGDLPFILFTGRGSETLAAEAISAGVTNYLRKSAGVDRFELLENRVRNAVDRHRARRQVEQLRRINEVIRNVQRGLLDASTREAVEQIVCDRLTQSDSYVFAWVGVPDADTGEVVPRARSGAAEEYLDRISVRADSGPRAHGPAGEAVRTGEVRVVQRVEEDPAFEPWRAVAAEYGFRSVAGVPVTTGCTFYGVLVIYADRRDAFDAEEREVLGELGETVGSAIRAAELRTELRERERELRESTRRLEDFASVVSHDLKSPLNVARGRLDLHAAACDTDGHLDHVRRAHDRIEELVDDVLALARGRAVKDGTPVDLAAVARSAWDTVDHGPARLIVEPDAPGTVAADERQLRQFLENLLRNAVEHGSASPRSRDHEDAVEHGPPDVTVRLGGLDDAEGFAVADDGRGIPRSIRDRIFRRGFTTAESGTGFGLGIVSEIAALHGWELRVRESDAGGARFEVWTDE